MPIFPNAPDLTVESLTFLVDVDDPGAATRRILTAATQGTGAVIANVANGNLTGGVPVVHVLEIPDAATADYDFVLAEKTEVFDVVVIKSVAGAANTVQVKNSATAITDAIAAAVDKAVTRAGTVDRASSVISAGGTLRLTVTRAAGSSLMRVFVYGVKRA